MTARAALALARDATLAVAIAVPGALAVGWWRYGAAPSDVAGVVATMALWAVLGSVLVLPPSFAVTKALVWTWRAAARGWTS